MHDIFRWKFPVGRIFGITIRVHWLFILVLLPLVLRFSLDKTSPAGTWIDALIVASIIAVSTLLHELGHCFGARSVGGEADEIMLWPLGGVADVNYLPATPWANFVMSACGPLANLILCVVSALALAFAFDQAYCPVFNPFDWYPFRYDGGFYRLTLWNGSAETTQSLGLMLVVWTFYVNWFLFAFNILLIGLPFDAGAMIRAALWPYVGYHQATMYMITSGFILAGLFFMGAFFFERVSAPLGFLALFAFFMCRREWLMLESRGEEGLFGYDFSQGYTSLEKEQPAPARKKGNFVQRWLQKRQAKKLIREQEMQEAEETRMDELLAKIQRDGKASLTEEEQRFLKRVSDRYRNRH